MIKLVRRGAIASVIAGLVFAAWKFFATRAPDTGGLTYQAQPFPMPPMPVAKPTPQPGNVAETSGDSVGPDPDGGCPLTHPIKGKLTSGIYHQPGGFAYERTKADRCYRDAAAAVSDGLRAAKR